MYIDTMPKKYYRILVRGDALRRARILAGETGAEMAESVGLSRPMLSSIENGAGTSVKTAHRIASHLGKSFEELFEIVDVGERPRSGRS